MGNLCFVKLSSLNISKFYLEIYQDLFQAKNNASSDNRDKPLLAVKPSSVKDIAARFDRKTFQVKTCWLSRISCSPHPSVFKEKAKSISVLLKHSRLMLSIERDELSSLCKDSQHEVIFFC
ncbi:unnamed protein product [Brugia pahangi]|uniref:HTH_48 domain-containing protein n=1 Tax=Brugia pahangi TaxID=6280 RepID=A0A0N4TGP3_BRUPA|nr:unnamed protein product [Brugia pahangi]